MAEETGAAFGIYPSAGRRPERLNQSRGVNAPLQLLRGWAAGTLGLPGDIEGLVRMLPGIKNETPVLPTSDFYREYLPGYDPQPAARAMSGLAALAGGAGATRVAGEGLGALKRATDVNAIRDYIRAAQGVSGLPGTAVVKPKGGNWLSGAGSPEQAVQGLKRSQAYVGMPPEALAAANTSDAALNTWIDQKLAKYIRNEMATPEDPVRALAERGVLHADPEQIGINRYKAPEKRSVYGGQQLGESEAARAWEDATDVAINAPFAGQMGYPSVLEKNPWLTKLDPQQRVYALNTPTFSQPEVQGLGFSHLVDELRNAVREGSDLPRELQLRPEQLSKVSMPQAVELVDRINKWRAAQKAEADLVRAGNAATVEHKAYDVIPGTTAPNERGLRWVELRMPDESQALPEGYSLSKLTNENLPVGHIGRDSYAVVDPQGRMLEGVGLTRTESGAVGKFRQAYYGKKLEDALKYEGETMGHCVGGYCPDVMEGKSRIYSLRDAKGQPHVTIEVKPDDLPNKFSDLWDVAMKHVPENSPGWEQLAEYGDDAYDLFKQQYGRYLDDPRAALEGILQYFPEAAEKTMAELNTPVITQIKGNANRAPKDEYLPYVQDFVKSGTWSDVGDLDNAKLIPIDSASDLAKSIRAAGGEPPRFVTQQELTELLRQNADPAKGFARGGMVSAGPAQYDPAAVEARAAALMGDIYA